MVTKNVLPKGILFDLDDTIVAFDAVVDSTWRSLCEVHASRSGLFTADCLFNALKEVRMWYWSDPIRHKFGRQDLDATRRKILSLTFEKLDIEAAPLANQIANEYSVQREEAIEFFPGAEETLQHLTNKGVLLALITNGEERKQRNKVERFGLDKFFRTILIEGELGFGKPDDRVYVYALRDLSLEPEEVWSVGDHLERDVAAPQKLGIFGIWNDFKKRGLPSSSFVVPDRIIHSISELVI